MLQSVLSSKLDQYRAHPFHVAIIMDGNGRWAERRGLPRLRGHRVGVQAVRRTLVAAPSFDISMLTLYAISSDNWKRPKEEVDGLLCLLETFLTDELEALRENDFRFVMIGQRDRLPEALKQKIDNAERVTADCKTLTIRLAVDYSSRQQMMSVFEGLHAPNTKAVSTARSGVGEPCDVDLLIRTSGEQRLSDFLLWECAYAELYFTDRLWPDFTRDDLAKAVVVYRKRNRRFGQLPNGKPEVTPRHVVEMA